MCGIAGVFRYRQEELVDRDVLQRMGDRLAHRGPDGEGFFCAPGVGLAHRRLAIIDLASGQQPMVNEDSSVAVVFNGEIYNYQEVRQQLQQKGCRFRTQSDTEVILRAFEFWGIASISHLRGMFAVAIWERRTDSLYLFRDRLGIKPLYYSRLADGTVIFASELKSLWQHPQFQPVIAEDAVADYVAYGYVPDPKTIYQGVYKLPPATCLCVRRKTDALKPNLYWALSFEPKQGRSGPALTEELMHELQQSVALHRIADVPIGAFLSGGIDSSAVVAMLAQLSDTPVQTCAIRFDDPALNEEAYAELVAKRYKTDHTVRTVAAEDFSLIDRMAEIFDEPFADSSALPTYRVCESARQRVKVALSGDGGDENFAGYRRYRMHVAEERARQALPSFIRRPLFGLLGQLYPKADWAPRWLRAKTTFQGLACDTLAGYFHAVSMVPDELRAQLFSRSFQRRLSGYHPTVCMQQHVAEAPTNDPLAFIQYLDFKTYLVGDILTKVDRTSMAHGLEVRVPLLDHRFVEWAAQVPSGRKLHKGEGKYVFKKALAPYLPAKILRRPKQGFVLPLARAMREELFLKMESMIKSEHLLDSGIFNPRFLQTMVLRHRQGVSDYSTALWVVWMFERFMATHKGSH